MPLQIVIFAVARLVRVDAPGVRREYILVMNLSLQALSRREISQSILFEKPICYRLFSNSVPPVPGSELPVNAISALMH
jgi:hypothetical protein